MRKSLSLTGVLLVFLLSASAQLDSKGKKNFHFILNKTFLVVSNRSLANKFSTKYMPLYQNTRNQSYPFEIWGKELIISIAEVDSSRVLAEYGRTGALMDSTRANYSSWATADMEARLLKNGSVLENWRKVTSFPSFRDPAIVNLNNSPHAHNAYWLFKDTLAVSDSIELQLRQQEAAPFIRVPITRVPLLKQPYMVAYADDSSRNMTDLSFISRKIDVLYKMAADSFYMDKPGAGLQMKNSRLWPHSKILFQFRMDSFSAQDSAFEYKITGAQYKGDKWVKSDSRIYIPFLEPGGQYKMEVRFAAYPENVSTYTFYTEPNWYQRGAVKWGLLVLLLLLLLSGYFLFRLRKEKKAAHIRGLEMKVLYAQLNPHFLFNALSSIQALINDAKMEKADKYLTGFASLLRAGIQTGNKEMISFSEEIKNLTNYVELEKLRFGFESEWVIDPALETAFLETPPFLVQPLLENAVKHAMAAKREKGLLQVVCKKEGRDIVFLIVDNGQGYTNQPTGGHGIRLTKERISLFNSSREKRKIVLDIMGSAEGTMVRVRYKNWL